MVPGCGGYEGVMKQILQNLMTGRTEVMEVPCPQVKPGHLLVRTRASVISAGTERMLVEFGKANLFEKARQQPDKVREVWDKILTDGVFSALDAVYAKLDQPLPLGYCNAGVVIEVGPGAVGFSVGDRVLSNGPHAEVVQVPQNLCVKIPESVGDEEAPFAVLGAVALQGIRLAQPSLGENFVVIGLGLLGLLTAQLLRTQGCRVLGTDLDPRRVALAERFGASAFVSGQGNDLLLSAKEFSRGHGVDGVIIATTTKSVEPVHQAAQMCRKRGRIVLVGVTGLELSRSDFYEKELTFQVSCSYGPGRYDPDYESKGQDYPYGFVRWTAQRNFEAVLDMLANGRLEVRSLISDRFAVENAKAAYDLLGTHDALGIVLSYPHEAEVGERRPSESIRLAPAQTTQVARVGRAVVGVVGAGNFACRILLPALQRSGARLKNIVSRDGAAATYAGRKFGFELSSTDLTGLFNDPGITTVVILTRHDSHAALVCRALQAGKHVFVEKPLAITREELSEIELVYRQQTIRFPDLKLMVGFNRRFAPLVLTIKSLLDRIREPKTFIMTVNAGHVPADHWTHDPKVGGGRIVGEGCHFVDLLRYLAGHHIVGVQATSLRQSLTDPIKEDKTSFTLEFADGSFGTVHYLANGHRSFPKERLEIFCSGQILQLDNFRRLHAYGWPGFTGRRLWRQDKGHAAEVSAFFHAVETGAPSPIPFHEMLEVTRTTFDIAEKVL